MVSGMLVPISDASEGCPRMVQAKGLPDIIKWKVFLDSELITAIVFDTIFLAIMPMIWHI